MNRITATVLFLFLASCAGSTTNPGTPVCEEGCRAEQITCKQVCPDQDTKAAEHAACESRCQEQFKTCATKC